MNVTRATPAARRRSLAALLRGLVLCSTLLLVPSAVVAQSPPDPPVPVLVELFTSQGCSSCPPADRLLRELLHRQPVAGVEVLGLSFHVDYWNHLGWQDPFSSSRWSSRQREYATLLGESTVFTPQMVVGGTRSLVGSDRSRILAAVAAAAERPPHRLQLDALDPDTEGAAWKIELRGFPSSGPTPTRRRRVHAALVEDGLSSSVRRGENAGRELSHVHVVRALHTQHAPDGGDGSVTISFEIDPDWRPEAIGVVAWLQEADGTIVALGRWQSPDER